MNNNAQLVVTCNRCSIHGITRPVMHYTCDDPDVISRGTKYSCGFDLRVTETAIVWPFSVHAYDTGVKFAIPTGHFGLIRPRSSLFMKGLYVEGVVDCDYVDHTVKLMVHNFGLLPRRIKANERIAQIVVASFVDEIHWVSKLDMPSTGRGGFCSTGSK